MSRTNRFFYIFFAALLLLPIYAAAQTTDQLSDGQSIYVPAYSHIYVGNNERPFLLTVTISIRNIDPHKSMRIKGVDYYETQGKLLKKFVPTTLTIGPLESIRYVIPEKEKVGGSGANFIIEWESDTPMNAPIAESIMIGAQSGQGISFTSRGTVIAQ